MFLNFDINIHLLNAGVKGFRFILEFRILRLTLQRKAGSKYLEYIQADTNTSSDLFSDFLKTTSIETLNY